MYKRIFDPTVQNRVLLFYGEQGIGKDDFLKTLCGGLGRYMLAPELPRGRNLESQHITEKSIGGAVALIDEFDRMKGAESIFKAIVTRDYITMRLPYDRKPQRIAHRTSYVASTNVANCLLDSTGNRRFILLKLKGGIREGIRWEYERGEYAQKQILAQFKALAQDGWKANESHERAMRELLEDETPDNVEASILEAFDVALADKEQTEGKLAGFYTLSDCSYIFERIAKDFDLELKQVKSIIKADKSIYKKFRLEAGRESKSSKRLFSRRENWELPSETIRQIIKGGGVNELV